ncbi:hypothetical protein Bhyg_12139, partial [Pseudolycoriella hygida]
IDVIRSLYDTTKSESEFDKDRADRPKAAVKLNQSVTNDQRREHFIKSENTVVVVTSNQPGNLVKSDQRLEDFIKSNQSVDSVTSKQQGSLVKTNQPNKLDSSPVEVRCKPLSENINISGQLRTISGQFRTYCKATIRNDKLSV